MRLRALLAAAALALLSACATTNGARTYLIRVEKGDTLASIAAKYDTTWDKIAKLNEFENGKSPSVGQVIRVQPGPGGIVAGAPVVSGSGGGKGRLSKSVPTGDAASPDEFEEQDFPGAPKSKNKAKKKGLLFGNGGDDGASLRWPLRGELSSMYGKRGRRQHQGIDIRAPRGTEIRAAAPGIVEFAGSKRGYGYLVVIRHAKKKTAYAHLSSVNVSRGEEVDYSTIIGKVGTTGNATGPHLHFETRTLEDRAFDPMTLLSRDTMLSQTAE